MSAGRPIKWRDSDVKQLQRAVKNFNAKLTRVLKKNPLAVHYLPERKSFKQLKSEIYSRNDFNKIVARLMRFSRRGAEAPVQTKGGVLTTKYELNEYRIAIRTINAKKRAALKKLAPSSEKGTLGRTIKEHQLTPIKDDTKTWSNEHWENIRYFLEHGILDAYDLKKADTYKENYIKAAYNNLGSYADSIVPLIERISSLWIYNIYADEPDLQIDFIYTEDEAIAACARILDALARHGYQYSEEEAERMKKDNSLAGVMEASSTYGTGLVPNELDEALQEIFDDMEDW